MKLRGKGGKWIVKQLLGRHLPSELFERPKSGFSMPMGEWLRGDLRDWAEDLLDPSRMRQEGYFDAARVQQRWQDNLAGRRNASSTHLVDPDVPGVAARRQGRPQLGERPACRVTSPPPRARQPSACSGCAESRRDGRRRIALRGIAPAPRRACAAARHRSDRPKPYIGARRATFSEACESSRCGRRRGKASRRWCRASSAFSTRGGSAPRRCTSMRLLPD